MIKAMVFLAIFVLTGCGVGEDDNGAGDGGCVSDLAPGVDASPAEAPIAATPLAAPSCPVVERPCLHDPNHREAASGAFVETCILPETGTVLWRGQWWDAGHVARFASGPLAIYCWPAGHAHSIGTESRQCWGSDGKAGNCDDTFNEWLGVQEATGLAELTF